MTIGYGHNLSASGLCEEALVVQLRYDISHTIAEMDRILPWWKTQPPAVQRVLLNMGFNLGATSLAHFGGFLSYIQLGQYALAAEDLLKTKYAKQVGQRAMRLASLLQSVV